MKTKQRGQTNLIEGGKESLESTGQFRAKVEELTKQVRDKYSLTILNEKNWAKRMLTVLRHEIEIRKRISEISSLKNLHAAHGFQM